MSTITLTGSTVEERIAELQTIPVEALIAAGDVEECQSCGGLSAYNYHLTDEATGEDRLDWLLVLLGVRLRPLRRAPRSG
jgi:hypothetical protein